MTIIIVFGGGMMAPPCVSYLAKNGYHVIVVDSRRNADLSLLSKGTPGKVTFIQADLSSAKDVRRVIQECPSRPTCAVSLLPPPMHTMVATECVGLKVPFVSASYNTDDMRALNSIAEEQGVVILNEMGLDPGMDLMSSAQLIEDIHSKGGKVVHYSSLCGALCAPQLSNGPLGYKFSWSPLGVLGAITRTARFLSSGTWFDVPGEYLYHLTCPIVDFKGLRLNWIPNGNAEQFVGDAYFKIAGPALRTAVRGTLRYDGYGPMALAFLAMGLLQDTPCGALNGCELEGKTWGDFMIAKHKCNTQEDVLQLCAEEFSATQTILRENGIDKAMTEVCFATDSKGESTSGFFASPFSLIPVSEMVASVKEFLDATDFLSAPIPKTAKCTPITALTAYLASTMMLDVSKGETDFVSMIHRVVAKFPDGNYRTFESTFAEGGTPYGFSTVANTVGVTVASAAICVAEKKVSQSGLRNPCEKAVFEPVMKQLHEARILFHERVVTSGTTFSSKI